MGKFEKGKSGNPGGRPRVPDDLKKSCQRLAARGLKVLEEIINGKTEFETIDGKVVKIKSAATPSEKIAAVRLAFEYGYGKPVQPLGGEDDNSPLVVKVLTLTSPDEAETPPPMQIPPPVA